MTADLDPSSTPSRVPPGSCHFLEDDVMQFASVAVGQLYSGHIHPDDRLRLHRMWESEPTVALALEECGMFIEAGADNDPDEDLRATVNEFLVHSYRTWGLSAAFLTLIRHAQDQRFQFIRVHSEALPTEGLPTFDV